MTSRAIEYQQERHSGSQLNSTGKANTGATIWRRTTPGCLKNRGEGISTEPFTEDFNSLLDVADQAHSRISLHLPPIIDSSTIFETISSRIGPEAAFKANQELQNHLRSRNA